MLLLAWCSLPTADWLFNVVENKKKKIKDREIFCLHEFSSQSNQNLMISLGLITEKHHMKLLGTTVLLPQGTVGVLAPCSCSL